MLSATLPCPLAFILVPGVWVLDFVLVGSIAFHRFPSCRALTTRNVQGFEKTPYLSTFCLSSRRVFFTTVFSFQLGFVCCARIASVCRRPSLLSVCPSFPRVYLSVLGRGALACSHPCFLPSHIIPLPRVTQTFSGLETRVIAQLRFYPRTYVFSV